MEGRKLIYDFITEYDNDDFLQSGFWGKKYSPPSPPSVERIQKIVNARSSKATQIAQSIAVDVEFVIIDSVAIDNEGCSGHECFYKRKGFRCIICKQSENGN